MLKARLEWGHSAWQQVRESSRESDEANDVAFVLEDLINGYAVKYERRAKVLCKLVEGVVEWDESDKDLKRLHDTARAYLARQKD